MNIGKRNENKKREECGKRAMGKTFVKILAALLAGGVSGGIFGFGSFWLQEEGFRYMVTGWYQDGKDWYYYNKDKNCQPVGSLMRNHWQGKYYLKDDGKMAKSETLVIGEKEYTFGVDGKVE